MGVRIDSRDSIESTPVIPRSVRFLVSSKSHHLFCMFSLPDYGNAKLTASLRTPAETQGPGLLNLYCTILFVCLFVFTIAPLGGRN